MGVAKGEVNVLVAVADLVAVAVVVMQMVVEMIVCLDKRVGVVPELMLMPALGVWGPVEDVVAVAAGVAAVAERGGV